MIVNPGTCGVYSLCIRGRNNSQEPDSETKDRNKRQKQEAKNKSDQEGTMKEVNNLVEYSKNGKFHKSPITSVPVPETSQNIIFPHTK